MHRRRRIDAFKIFPRKILVAYFLGVVLMLVASSLVVMVGLAQLSSVDYSITNNKSLPIPLSSGSPFTSGIVITEQSVRSIYTSSVPETIAEGINNLLVNSSSSLAYPMTVSLANVNGNSPIVVRGLPYETIQNIVASTPVGLDPAGNWTLIGAKAAEELNARVGSILTIQYPLSLANSSFSVVVKGIYSLGNEGDYEALVPIKLGQEINGLSSGVVNAIVAPAKNLSNLDIQSLVRSNYLVKLDYSGAPGSIDVVDSSGYAHNVLSASSNSSFIQGTFTFLIPFGSYTLVLDQNGIRTTLTQFTPSKNDTTIQASSKVQTGSTQSFLYVKNDSSISSSQYPKLLSSQNETISPESYNETTDYWVFQVSQGLYTLELTSGVNITKILIIGNATFDPNSSLSNLNSTLNVSISSPGELLSSYSINVQDANSSEVIYSRSTSSTSLSIPVASNHNYTISVLDAGTNILLQDNVSIAKSVESASFIFPAIPFNFGSVPVSDYSSLGIGLPSKSGSFDFLIGGAVTSTIALFAIVFALLCLALVSLSRQLFISLQKEIKALKVISPSRSSIRSRLKLPIYLLLFTAVISTLLISFSVFQLFGFSSSLTFLGYGLEVYPLLFILPVIVVLALVSYLKISISMDREIFGGTRNRS